MSPRRKEILTLLLRGMTNAEIGEELGISARTVKQHVTVLMLLAGARNRVEILRHFVPGEWQDWPELSARDNRIAALVAQGKTNGEIGAAIGSSEQSVKQWLQQIFDVVGVWTRLELAARCGDVETVS